MDYHLPSHLKEEIKLNLILIKKQIDQKIVLAIMPEKIN